MKRNVSQALSMFDKLVRDLIKFYMWVPWNRLSTSNVTWINVSFTWLNLENIFVLKSIVNA